MNVSNKLLGFCLFVLLLSPPLKAAVLCASNSAELVTALQTAATNGEDDSIRLAPGEYVPQDQNGFVISLIQDDQSIEISGGWTSVGPIPCASRSRNVRASRIVGNESLRLLRTTTAPGVTSGSITLTNLSFIDGIGSDFQNIGAVHLAFPPSSVEVLIDRVLFSGNTGYAGAALTSLGAQRLTIRNALFEANTVQTQQGSIFITLSGNDQRLIFVNNTVINNGHSGTIPVRCSGLWISTPVTGSSPDMLIANSIFWDNDDFDACMPANGDSYLLHNNIQDLLGSPTVTSNNLSIEPMLSTVPMDITPVLGSAMINAGLTEPGPPGQNPPITEDWSYGTFDFNTFSTGRVIDNLVDIGAAESSFVDQIFCDAFDSGDDC